MKFKYKSKISFTSLFLNLVVLTGFFCLILNSYKFKDLSNSSRVQAYGGSINILKEEIPDGSTINVNNIYIDNDLNGTIYYIVQAWDSLSKISSNFWVTVSHIKKINRLTSDTIYPNQKLVITEEEWFLYTSKWEKASELANKFNVKKEDIITSNGLNVDDYVFVEQDEVFIPMSDEQYKKMFPEKKKQSSIVYQPNNTNFSYKNKNIVAKYWYSPNITNWFYKWHCTRYVAIKKFPYITPNKQNKLWNGNAKYWYQNAKNAWYSVWQTPKVGSIVVIKIWWRNYYYAWHVWIVKEIDWKNKKILIEEMNAVWKYIVTKRWISMDSNIIWYIYI